MELKFVNDLDSAKRLDEIMNSYPGRDRGSVLADERSLTVMLTLLEYGKISVTEYTYPYDHDIRSDSGMMDIYAELARETRWKQFYVFAYPYWTEDRTAKYYRFDLTETAIAGAMVYRESVWNKMLEASKASGVIPVIPQYEDEQLSSS